VVSAVLVALAVGCSSQNQTSGNAKSVRLVEGADARPSSTASDWVTYADYVLITHAAFDSEVTPSAMELSQGAGVINRRVHLIVDSVLWTRPGGASVPAPASFDWTAFGWFFDGDPSNRVKMAGAGEPRIEPGHAYVMAVFWKPAVCDGPTVASPARWQALGGQSVVPFDNEVLGNGESEGRVQTADERISAQKSAGQLPEFPDGLIGRTSKALRVALQAAPAEPQQSFGPVSVCAST
jgi:hypothetical protein